MNGALLKMVRKKHADAIRREQERWNDYQEAMRLGYGKLGHGDAAAAYRQTKKKYEALSAWVWKYARPATLDDWRKYVLAAVRRGRKIQHYYDYPYATGNRNNPACKLRAPYVRWLVIKQPPENGLEVPPAWGADSITLLVPNGIRIEVSGHNSAIYEDGKTSGFVNLCTFSDF